MTYDEMGMFRENADEFAIPWSGPPVVRRCSVDAPGGRLSALVWGTGEPELVLLHGGAQNAHTWDTVALALARPLVAIDLPGHGHSDWREDHRYSAAVMAESVAAAVSQLAPAAAAVVGMSLGGITSICLAADHPALVRRLAVIDVTPGTDHAKAEPIIAFIAGPERFASFEAMLERTIEHNPTRSKTSLRRGVLHNARAEADGSWVWRYDRSLGVGADPGEGRRADFASLWESVERISAPLLLVRGGTSGVVGDEDVVELMRRQPSAHVVVVDGAGHSVQGDRPVELARILEAFLTDELA